MIHIKSVLDGFPVVLGSMPVQFGMLMTLLLSIKIPKDLNDSEKSDEDALFVYVLLCVTHAAILVIKYLQQWLALSYFMLYKALMMGSLFLQLFTINFVLGNWVFDQTDPDQLETKRGADWQNDKAWQVFTMWLRIEQYVFMGTIASGVSYMLLRSFFKCQIEIKEAADTASETTDHLEANRIVLEINDSNLTPLFTSLLLVNDSHYQPSSEISLCVDMFFLG